MNWISDRQVRQIGAVPHFKDSHDSTKDLNETLNFYMANFVDALLKDLRKLRIEKIADIGTGYGWLAIAFALRVSTRITAVDCDAARLAAAERIAGIMGVADRIDWQVGGVGRLPLGDRSMDATYCVEVLEHVGTDPDVVRDLGRITRETLVITTPNKLFPIINHDTALPFCHWLPLNWRDTYASMFGRRAYQDNNAFWSPSLLMLALKDFERISRFFQFPTYRDYWEANRLISKGRKDTLHSMLTAYYKVASLFGGNAIYILPNLASTFRRRAP